MKITKPKRPNFKYSPETKEGRLERAVAVLHAPGGFASSKVEFLRLKGLSGLEIMEALNIASGGELLRAAGLETASGDGE
jgi:hypothetical protein